MLNSVLTSIAEMLLNTMLETYILGPIILKGFTPRKNNISGTWQFIRGLEIKRRVYCGKRTISKNTVTIYYPNERPEIRFGNTYYVDTCNVSTSNHLTNYGCHVVILRRFKFQLRIPF